MPTFAVYGAAAIDAQGMAEAAAAWRGRLERLFDDEPIAFRPQNGGDYPDRHVLADHVAPGQSGFMAHIAGSVVPEDDDNSSAAAFLVPSLFIGDAS